MELRQAILERRSIRRYSDTPVHRELLEDLLTTACWAPSGLNRQPWYFVALQSEERLSQLKEIMRGVSRREQENLQRIFPSHPEVVADTRRFLETLGGAPVCLLVFLAKEYPDTELTMIQSTAAAVQTFLLLAREKGLSTCWITGHLSAENIIRETFGRGRGRCIALVTVGYQSTPAAAPRRHFNSFEFL